jgi:L-LDH-NAD: L-lactate dehydrogenase
MDLNHGLSFAKTNMKIYAGSYTDCRDADIVVICAGVRSKARRRQAVVASTKHRGFQNNNFSYNIFGF